MKRYILFWKEPIEERLGLLSKREYKGVPVVMKTGKDWMRCRCRWQCGPGEVRALTAPHATARLPLLRRQTDARRLPAPA